MEVRRIQNNGSSFLITIPGEFVRALRLDSGDHVLLELETNQDTRISTIRIARLQPMGPGEQPRAKPERS